MAAQEQVELALILRALRCGVVEPLIGPLFLYHPESEFSAVCVSASIGARRIFIDGVARLVGSNGVPEPRSAFHVLTEGLQRENLTAILAVEASALFKNNKRPWRTFAA